MTNDRKFFALQREPAAKPLFFLWRQQNKGVDILAEQSDLQIAEKSAEIECTPAHYSGRRMLNQNDPIGFKDLSATKQKDRRRRIDDQSVPPLQLPCEIPTNSKNIAQKR